MKNKKIIFWVIIIILVFVAASIFYIFNKQKALRKPYHYENLKLPSYLIKNYRNPEYMIGGLLDNDYMYYSKAGKIICRDANKEAERIEYYSFGAGSGVMGGWGSADAHICGDYYIIEDCNDAWGCRAYGVFKKNEGYQPNIYQKFVKDQLSGQTSPINTAEDFYGYQKAFNPSGPNDLKFNVNMRLLLSSKTWNCLNDRYNNNLKNFVDEVPYTSAKECGLEYIKSGDPDIVFNIKSQTPTTATVTLNWRIKVEESDYYLVFENGYWRLDSTLDCSAISNPCGVKNVK